MSENLLWHTAVLDALDHGGMVTGIRKDVTPWKKIVQLILPQTRVRY
jgi:hypothetical protein